MVGSSDFGCGVGCDVGTRVRGAVVALCAMALLGAAPPPERSSGGMVAADHRLGSMAGAEIMAQGGNAVDAAVATGFALAVTLPRAGNIGGGGFMLIHLAETDEQIFIDYRETAPAAATGDMFLKEDGSVDQAKAYFSHQAAGVPGTVAGLIHAQERYGKLALKEVIQPAIDLAKKGFDTPLALHMSLSARAERLAKNEEAKRIYLQGGDAAPSPGTLFQQTDLARTLTRIRNKGAVGIGDGEVRRVGALAGHRVTGADFIWGLGLIRGN